MGCGEEEYEDRVVKEDLGEYFLMGMLGNEEIVMKIKISVFGCRV